MGEVMRISTIDDFLRCVRNDLVPENLKTCFGIEGLLQYRIMYKIRHVDSIYEGYDKVKRKYYGKSITAEYFEKIYNIDPFDDGSSGIHTLTSQTKADFALFHL